MSKNTQEVRDDVAALAEDARALLTATAGVAEEKCGGAPAPRGCSGARQGNLWPGSTKAVEGAKVADQAVHEHPYQAIGIALGVGALIGYLVARRCSHKGD